MLRRLDALALPALIAASAMAGCMAPPAATVRGGTVSLTVSARFAPVPARTTLTFLPAPRWTVTDVDLVRFKVYLVGSTDTGYPITFDVPAPQARTQDTRVTIGNLGANATYLVEARAYDTDTGSEVLISQDDPAKTKAWQASIVVGNDTVASLAAPLQIQLLDRPFSGTTELGDTDLSLTSGICVADVQGVATTVAGGGGNASDGAAGLNASLPQAGNLAVADDGKVYVSLTANHTVMRIDPDRTIHTVVGQGVAGTGLGAIGAAALDSPRGLALIPDGSGKHDLAIADHGNDRIVRIDLDSADPSKDSQYATLLAGGGTSYDAGTATDAAFDGPSGLAASRAGDLAVVDRNRHTVRLIRPNRPPGSPDFVTRIAGDFTVGRVDATDAVQGKLSSPFDIVPFRDGFLIGEQGAATAPAFRTLTPDGTGWSLATHFVAPTTADADGDRIVRPFQIGVDHAERIWVADFDPAAPNVFIRKIDLKATGDERLSTWLRGQAGTPRDGHVLDTASMALPPDGATRPHGLFVVPSGAVYFSDPTAGAVRKLL